MEAGNNHPKHLVIEETNGWDKAPDKSDPEARRQQGGDPWQILSRDATVKQETGAWGTWGSANGQEDADGCNRDIKPKNERGEPLELTNSDSWKRHAGDSNVKRLTDRRVSDKSGKGPWEHHKTYDNFERPADRLSRSPNGRIPDVQKQTSESGWGEVKGRADEWGKAPYISSRHGLRGNMKRETNALVKDRDVRDAFGRETGLWDKEQDMIVLDVSKKDGGEGKRVTDGWRGAPDSIEPDASKQHVGKGNAKEQTGGWGPNVSEDCTDPWKRLSKDASIQKETSGWGTWGAGHGQSGPAASNHHSRNDSAKKESEGWDKPPTQSDLDPRKRQNDNRESDRWRKSPDQSSRAKRRHHSTSRSTSPELQPNRNRSRYPPIGSKRGRDGGIRIGSGGSAEACRNFTAGRCKWGSECKYSHDDRGRGESVGQGAGKSADTCRSFAAGRCKWGSECKFIHEDSGPGRFDRDIPEVREHRYENEKSRGDGNKDREDRHGSLSDGKGRQDVYNVNKSPTYERDNKGGKENQDLTVSRDKTDRHQSQSDGKQRQELHSVNNSPTYERDNKGWRENQDLTVSRDKKDIHRSQSDGKQRQELHSVKKSLTYIHDREKNGSNKDRECWNDGKDRQELHNGKKSPTCEKDTNGWKENKYHTVLGEKKEPKSPPCHKNEKEQNGQSEDKYLTVSGNKEDRHRDQSECKDMQELFTVTKYPTCVNSVKVRCNRGPECTSVHIDASDGGQCRKDQPREMILDTPCFKATSACQPASGSASNSAHSTYGDDSHADNIPQPMGDRESTQEPLSHHADSCTSTFQHSSHIGTDRLMLDGDTLHVKSSHKTLRTKDQEQKQVNGDAMHGVVHDKKEKVPPPVTVSAAADKDDALTRKFKFALADHVKVIIKPTWKEGRLTKEAHNLVVKKSVDKVVSVLPGPSIPQTQEQIDQYISFSEAKLKSLVQAYLRKYVGPAPKLGKN